MTSEVLLKMMVGLVLWNMSVWIGIRVRFGEVVWGGYWVG